MDGELIDFVCIGRDTDTGTPSAILILDTSGEVAWDLSPDLARETARRLDALADELEQQKPLRRLRAVDDLLRDLGDPIPGHAP